MTEKQKRYVKCIVAVVLILLVALFTIDTIQKNDAVWGDGIVFIFLLLVLVGVGAWYFIEEDRIALELKQLAKTGLIAVIALALRFPLLRIDEEIRGASADSLLLAVAAGSVASFVILWIDRQKLQTSDSETSVNRVTWTFENLSDDEKYVEMKYERIQERTNLSDKEKYGWTTEWFEPYPGTEGVQSACVRVAEEEDDLLPGAQMTGNELPLMDLDGFVIRLNEQSQDAKKYKLKQRETKWFKIEATLIVPVSYWDYSIGLVETELSQKPQFTMTDNTGKLALILASADNQLALNFDEKGKRKRNTIQLNGTRKGRLRAQACWYHKDDLTENTARLMKARFGLPID